MGVKGEEEELKQEEKGKQTKKENGSGRKREKWK